MTCCDDYSEDNIPNKVWVALEVLKAAKIPTQVENLVFDIIVNYLKEDSNV